MYPVSCPCLVPCLVMLCPSYHAPFFQLLFVSDTGPASQSSPRFDSIRSGIPKTVFSNRSLFSPFGLVWLSSEISIKVIGSEMRDRRISEISGGITGPTPLVESSFSNPSVSSMLALAHLIGSLVAERGRQAGPHPRLRRGDVPALDLRAAWAAAR